MSDIFLSYAREDLERVRPLLDVFNKRKWSVWWDDRISAGMEFNSAILKELNDAKCVVVIWPEHSVNSNWVIAEAAQGLGRSALVPVIRAQNLVGGGLA